MIIHEDGEATHPPVSGRDRLHPTLEDDARRPVRPGQGQHFFAALCCLPCLQGLLGLGIESEREAHFFPTTFDGVERVAGQASSRGPDRDRAPQEYCDDRDECNP